MSSLDRGRRFMLFAALAAALLVVPSSLAVHVTDGVDVKVIERQQQRRRPDSERLASTRRTASRTRRRSRSARSDVNIVAAGANDYRMVTVAGGDVWLGFYVSADGGATWFNTYVPGFPSDTSAAGLASRRCKGLDARVTRSFASLPDGDLSSPASPSTATSTSPTGPWTTSSTSRGTTTRPGTPGGMSTPNVRREPAELHVRGNDGRRPGRGRLRGAGPAGFAGTFTDKEWMEIDRNAPSASPCAGNVYVALHELPRRGRELADRLQRLDGRRRDVLASRRRSRPAARPARRNNQGRTSRSGPTGRSTSPTAPSSAAPASTRSTSSSRRTAARSGASRCRRAGQRPQAPGVAFRTPTFAFVAADDTNPNVVYVAYQHLVGDYDVYVQRSTERRSDLGRRRPGERRIRARATRSSRRSTSRTATCTSPGTTSGTASTPANEALDVYYASSEQRRSAVSGLQPQRRA